MARSTSNAASIYNDPLSRREVRLLSDWERERRLVVTIQDIRERVGSAAAADVARKLVRKRVLQRLRRGRYLVRPFRSLVRATERSLPLAVEALLHDEPHYLGGLWALSFHRLTEQRYASALDAFVTHRLASRHLAGGRVRFHVLESGSFEHGVTTATIEGMSVHLSDLERTLLDAFDYPRIFGGLERAVEIASTHLDRFDEKRLLAYAVSRSKPSTCQRLGVLLQREGVSPRLLAKLRVKARKMRSLLSMVPEAPRTGRVNREWNVVENDR